jgi:hypothetical protein
MVGPAVPVPVGKEVLDALESVRVTIPTQGPGGFQLTFTLSNRSPLQTIFLLSGGAALPLVRVIIMVTVKGTPEVLIDGVMTNHEVSPGAESGSSTLTVTGEDLSRVMDYLEFSGTPYPAMPGLARVALIIAKYAVLGVIPVVIPPIFSDIPIPVDKIPTHVGTDLDYIKYLAGEVGHVFYMIPGPAPGVSRAYWGPEVKIGVPQPALNINMDAHTNVESLTFGFNSEARQMPVVFLQNKQTRVPIPIPIPDISLLNPPLGVVKPLPKQYRQIPGMAKASPVAAAARGIAEASRSSDAVSGNGSLDVLRYGRVLKSRQLVGVRGAGTAFDGLYYVDSVTHEIRRGEYKQRFSLTRNGLVSITPRVPV